MKANKVSIDYGYRLRNRLGIKNFSDKDEKLMTQREVL